MNRLPKFPAFALSALVLAWSVPAFAQDPSSTQEPDAQNQQTMQPAPGEAPPKPAGRGNPNFSDNGDAVTDSGIPIRPDSSTLTGVQVAGLGTQQERHSYIVPGVQFGNFFRSSTLEAPEVGNWNSTTFIAGNLSVLQQWSRAQFVMNYTGGGTFATDSIQGNGYYHQLQAQQTFEFRHAKLSFIDQFSYLPQAQFGFGVASPLAIAGIGGPLGPSLPALQTNYLPNQSIFDTVGSRYSNSATTELAAYISPRSTVTFSGSYGFLRFVEPGNIASNDAIFSLGYDYQVTKRDTVGILYRFTGYRYLGDPQKIDDHVVQLAYGRKVTGRAALQLFIGPEITEFHIPVNNESQRISISGGGNLTYAVSHTNFTIGYNHGVSAGSGAFAGSTADQINGSATRHLTRIWDGNINLGYARNRSLGGFVGTLSEPEVNSWFAGAGVQRPLGRTATASLAYTAFIENSFAGCSTGACIGYLQHQISVSFQWHLQPVVIE
ncbi:MAG TPA: hypothetical protein VGJ06_18760 [Candidatus Acidoferrum sp.]|jgi:hypothetical protein